jgi:hypothetical protein
MNKKLLFLSAAAVLVLAGAGCGAQNGTPAPENQNQNTNQTGVNENGNINVNVEPGASGETTVSAPEQKEATGEVSFVDYANKSLGYKIVRPDKWYWQHLIQKQIGDKIPGVTDLFATDPNPLPSLSSENLGRIAIEALNKSLDEVSKDFSDLNSSDVTVGGISATKYEGVRAQNKKVIAYVFEKGGKTYKIIYTRLDSTAKDEAVLEKLIDSFSF